MADSEVVQVGRGGAGNFYTKKHVENSQVTRNEVGFEYLYSPYQEFHDPHYISKNQKKYHLHPS